MHQADSNAGNEAGQNEPSPLRCRSLPNTRVGLESQTLISGLEIRAFSICLVLGLLGTLCLYDETQKVTYLD